MKHQRPRPIIGLKLGPPQGTPYLRCPSCGSKDIEWSEMVPVRRTIESITVALGVPHILIPGPDHGADWEAATDQHLICRVCGTELSLEGITEVYDEEDMPR